MNIGQGDYYSVSSKGYVKHPNVEIIGVENYPSLPKAHALSTPAPDK